MRQKYSALWLSFICIIIFILQLVILEFTEVFILDRSAFIEFWRFVTAIFLHGSVGHLLYNIFALALFGTLLEQIIGTKRFLFVFFSTGIFANLVSLPFYESALGASGAIFGVIGTLIIMKPMLLVWAFGLPMPIFIAGILWALGDFIGIFVPSNVGNIAHLGGLFLGLVIGMFLRDWRRKRNHRESFLLNEHHARAWEKKYMK